MYRNILVNAPLLGEVSASTLKSFGDFVVSRIKAFKENKDFIVGLISKADQYDSYTDWISDPEYSEEFSSRFDSAIVMQDGTIVQIGEFLEAFWSGLVNDDSGVFTTQLQNVTITADDVLIDMALTDQTATIQSAAFQTLNPDSTGLPVADLGYIVESAYSELLPESKQYLVNLVQLLNDRTLSAKDKLSALLDPFFDCLLAQDESSDIELKFATDEGGYSGVSPAAAWAAGLNIKINLSTVVTTVVSAYKAFYKGTFNLLKGIGKLAIKLGKKAAKWIDNTFINGIDFIEIDDSSADNVVDVPVVQYHGGLDAYHLNKWVLNSGIDLDDFAKAPYKIETPYGYILLKYHGGDLFSLQVFVRPIDPFSVNSISHQVGPVEPDMRPRFQGFQFNTIPEVAMIKIGADEGFDLKSIPEGMSQDQYAYYAIQASLQRFDFYMGLMYYHYHKKPSDYGFILHDDDVFSRSNFDSIYAGEISTIFGIPFFDNGYSPGTVCYQGMITGAHAPVGPIGFPTNDQFQRYQKIFGDAPTEPTNNDFIRLLNGEVWQVDSYITQDTEHPMQLLLATCIAMVVAKDVDESYKITNDIDPIFVPFTRYTKPLSPRYGIVSDSQHGSKITKVFLGITAVAAAIGLTFLGFKGFKALKRSIVQAGARAQGLSRLLSTLDPSDTAYNEVTTSLIKANRKLKRLSRIGSLFGIASTSLISSAADVAYSPSGLVTGLLPSIGDNGRALSTIIELIQG